MRAGGRASDAKRTNDRVVARCLGTRLGACVELWMARVVPTGGRPCTMRHKSRNRISASDATRVN